MPPLYDVLCTNPKCKKIHESIRLTMDERNMHVCECGSKCGVTFLTKKAPNINPTGKRLGDMLDSDKWRREHTISKKEEKRRMGLDNGT